ncbi:MAG: DHH family phosphoesterase [Methanomicrobiales archaeon]|nr:DHH family phosphoesterase [Methanomicrobiales archaeon]
MGFSADIDAVAGRIRDAEAVTVVSHIDADGIASEAILAQAIAQEGIPVTSVFVRQLEPLTMRHVPIDDTLKVFVDLGAGQQNLLEEHGLYERDAVIIDHHVAQPAGIAYQQVNGLDHGHTKLSAAGIAYFVATCLDDTNVRLAPLGVIGNVGDMMAREHCGLVGPARDIVSDGVREGTIRHVERDLNCYGLSTRPVHVCLSYCDDPYIPRISNNAQYARSFLENLDIPLREHAGRWRVWEEFSIDERRAVISGIAQQLIAHGQSVDRLFAETYYFPDEAEQTPLRNASEYATLLNACGRWAQPRIGSAVCRGDRGSAYRDAEQMLRHHRSIIRELVQFIADKGVTELSHLQYLHVGDRFPDTIVGIGAGISLSKLNWRKPIMILCYLPDDPELVKVSMRTNERMVSRGIDLQHALQIASAEVGGAGGGHAIAAGAYIPKVAEQEFADRVNRVLREQSA